MYFIDELNGGNIYKYTHGSQVQPRVNPGRPPYFAAGQTFVLRVGDGNTPNATGAYTWVPFTDATGAGLPGALTMTDTNGVTSVDARNTTNLLAFKGTDYQRPEDMVIQTVKGRQYLYVATTTTHEVYRLDLANNTIAVFADGNTIDLATGAARGRRVDESDNLAVDHDGHLYIVEDRNGGVDDDIWFATDINQDGDLHDPGEGLGTLGVQWHGGIGIHRPVLRPLQRASSLGQHPASG